MSDKQSMRCGCGKRKTWNSGKGFYCWSCENRARVAVCEHRYEDWRLKGILGYRVFCTRCGDMYVGDLSEYEPGSRIPSPEEPDGVLFPQKGTQEEEHTMMKTLPRPVRAAFSLAGAVGSGVELAKAVRELNETNWDEESPQARTEKTVEVVTKAAQTALWIFSTGYQLKK